MAFPAFLPVLRLVEAARAALASAAPTGRPARVSVAEALLGFEQGLREAASAMPGWRGVDTEAVWVRCRAGLDEAASRAERLRLEGSPEGYEQLVAAIDRLFEPLEAFEDASVWFRSGRSGRP